MGILVALLPGCGGGNEDQETEAVTSGQENPEEGVSLQDFLPGKAVVGAFVEGELFDKASMRFLFTEGGGFTLSEIGRNRKASGTYEVKGPVVVVRIEDEEAIAELEDVLEIRRAPPLPPSKKSTCVRQPWMGGLSVQPQFF